MKSRQWLLSLAASVSIASLVIGGIHIHSLGGTPHPDFGPASGGVPVAVRQAARPPPPPAEEAPHRGVLECGAADPPDVPPYWRIIPTDDRAVSPWAHAGPDEAYVTFEPDAGGWNNVRMAMETVAAFALATGRTLVLPPAQPLYLLHMKGKRHGFGDFFPLGDARPLRVIEAEEFLRRQEVHGSPVVPEELFGVQQKALDENNARRKQMWKWLRGGGGDGSVAVPKWCVLRRRADMDWRQEACAH